MAPPTKPASPWLVTTDWLASRLKSPDLVVVDGSFYLPAQKRDAAAEYKAGHIPGAVRVTQVEKKGKLNRRVRLALV